MALLHLDDVDVQYGDMQAVFAVSLRVEQGEAVALIGANGAGKTTLLRSIIGLHPIRRGRIRFDQTDLAGMSCDAVARRGIALVPEGRRLFGSLTISENITLGSRSSREGPWTLDAVLELFPAIKQFLRRRPAEISGGQQQMVAVARALMTNPRLLLCDEISLGLAPSVIEDLYRSLPSIRKSGVSVILVEQDIARARAASDRLYCLLKGRVTLQGDSHAVDLPSITQAYFGGSTS